MPLINKCNTSKIHKDLPHFTALFTIRLHRDQFRTFMQVMLLDDEMTFTSHKKASLHNTCSLLGAVHPVLLPIYRLPLHQRQNWTIFITTQTFPQTAIFPVATSVMSEALTVINQTMALLFTVCSHGNNVWCLLSSNQGIDDHKVTGFHFSSVLGHFATKTELLLLLILIKCQATFLSVCFDSLLG